MKEKESELRRLDKEREIHRKNKNWKEADKIREKIKKLGYSVEDLYKINETRFTEI